MLFCRYLIFIEISRKIRYKIKSFNRIIVIIIYCRIIIANITSYIFNFVICGILSISTIIWSNFTRCSVFIINRNFRSASSQSIFFITFSIFLIPFLYLYIYKINHIIYQLSKNVKRCQLFVKISFVKTKLFSLNCKRSCAKGLEFINILLHFKSFKIE